MESGNYSHGGGGEGVYRGAGGAAAYSYPVDRTSQGAQSGYYTAQQVYATPPMPTAEVAYASAYAQQQPPQPHPQSASHQPPQQPSQQLAMQRGGYTGYTASQQRGGYAPRGAAGVYIPQPTSTYVGAYQGQESAANGAYYAPVVQAAPGRYPAGRSDYPVQVAYQVRGGYYAQGYPQAYNPAMQPRYFPPGYGGYQHPAAEYPNRPFRGRGGAGHRGGRGSAAGHFPRSDVFFVVHVDSFDKLEAGRKGAVDEMVPSSVLQGMTAQARGAPVKALVVVEKRYLAACISLPRHSDDMILSQATAAEFLDIHSVLCDDGSRLIHAESGTHVAKHMFLQLRSGIAQLVPFDKPEEPTAVNVFEKEPRELIKELASSRCVYEALIAALKEDSERSLALFTSLWNTSKSSAARNEGTVAAEDLGESVGPNGEGTAPSSATPSSLKSPSGRRVPLLASAQGVRVLDVALQYSSMRRAFFELMRESPDEIEGEAESSSLAEEIFKVFFSGVLTSRLVFQCFGVSTLPDAEAPSLPQNVEEVSILCDGFARHGISVICGNGGSCMLTALVKALRPRYKTYETSHAAGRRGGRGAKRGREDPATAPSGGAEESRQQRTEEGSNPAESRPKETPPRAPSTLADYDTPEAPADWRIFYAAAAAFTSGHLPASQGKTPAEENASPLATRVQLLTQHIVACRAVQTLLPHFADSLLDMERASAVETTVDPLRAQYHAHCHSFLGEIGRRSKELVVHNYGNYVAQTLITELAPRAIPGTSVEAILRAMLDTIVDHLFDMSVQKFASNCVERAIAAAAVLTDGHQLILRMARALMEKGEQMMIQVASHQFGNYVVRHLCEKLTTLATGQESTAEPGEMEEARSLEQSFFTMLSSRQSELQKSNYGVGLVSWLNTQQVRHAPATTPA